MSTTAVVKDCGDALSSAVSFAGLGAHLVIIAASVVRPENLCHEINSPPIQLIG